MVATLYILGDLIVLVPFFHQLFRHWKSHFNQNWPPSQSRVGEINLILRVCF